MIDAAISYGQRTTEITMDKEPNYEIVMITPGIGRTRWLIRCNACGREKWVFVWSFAGHGKTQCMGCHKWIKYENR
jgi:hypothetical protein